MVLHVHSYQLERQLGQRCVCVCEPIFICWSFPPLLFFFYPIIYWKIIFLFQLYSVLSVDFNLTSWADQIWTPPFRYVADLFFFRLPTRKVIKNHDSWSARIRFLFSCFSSSQTPNWHVWFPGTWIFFISCFLLPSCWIILPLCLCCFGLVSSLHLYLLTLCRISSQLSLGGDWLLYVINL